MFINDILIRVLRPTPNVVIYKETRYSLITKCLLLALNYF